MLIISRHDEERLGLPQVLDACRCYSPQGRRLKAKRAFYAPSDRSALAREFDAIELLIVFLHEHPTDVRRAAVTLGRFRDLVGTLSGLEKRRPLEVTELFEIKQALQLFRELSAMEPLLHAASVEVTAMPEAEALLDPGDRKTSGFYLYDEYSPRLAELRRRRFSVERQMESGDSSQRESLLAERASLVAEEEREEAVVRARLTDALAAVRKLAESNGTVTRRTGMAILHSLAAWQRVAICIFFKMRC
jgi:DNA mismatch repair protein MutS2